MGRPAAAGPGAAAAVAESVTGIALACAAVILLRPLLPVDETRYLTVAWEMWLRGDYLVPHLNGELYPHKPPLLFWLIQLAWGLAGVSGAAARMVSPVFALGTVAATVWIGRMLWPEAGRTRFAAAIMLVGMPVFLIYATLAMFDVPLAFITTVGTASVLRLASGGRGRWWALYAVSIGAGILMKGPVALLFLLPAPLFAPLWRAAPPAAGWRRWYLATGAATLAGLALVLLWLVPAIARGGDDYARAILWRQTAGRVSGSFGHPRPWWFYLALLPAILYPWGWMPTAWRGVAAGLRTDRSVRFCLCATLPPLLVLSAVHGKQLHYLVPALPFAALLFARGFATRGPGLHTPDIALPLLLPVAAALCLFAGPQLVAWLVHGGLLRRVPHWIELISPGWGFYLLVIAVGPVLIAAVVRASRIEGLAASSLAVFVAVQFAGRASLFPLYDLRPVSTFLGRHQSMPIAYNRDHQGEFGFLGRLKRPLEEVPAHAMAGWIARHSNALVVCRYKTRPAYLVGEPVVDQPYRGERIGVWMIRSAAGRPAKDHG